MSSLSTWKLVLTEDEADLAVRALRFAEAQTAKVFNSYSDPPICFGAKLARDRCGALATKIAGITGVEDGS